MLTKCKTKIGRNVGERKLGGREWKSERLLKRMNKQMVEDFVGFITDMFE